MESERGDALRTLILIPALNEEETIGQVLEELRDAALGHDVLVIDDGSSDNTSEVARSKGAIVARLPFNLGVGGALRTGLAFAYRHSYLRAVQLDADGQHDPGEIKRLLEGLDKGADLVIGSRFAKDHIDYRPGRFRGGAMRLLGFTMRLASGNRLTDTTSGFRAFGPEAIALFVHNHPAEYLSDTVESILLAAYGGLKIVEVPTKMRYRVSGVPSTRNIKLVYHYLRLLLSIVTTFPLRRRKA